MIKCNKWTKALICVISFFGANIGYAQFDGLQINLEKKSMVSYKNQRISIFCSYDGQHCYVGNKANPKYDASNPDTWSKRDADTLQEISKRDFNRIAELSLALSSINLLGGLNPSEISITHDPTIIELEITIGGQKVTYSLFLPLNQNDFHFGQFEALCEEIIILANKNPDEFLERKGKKWPKK
jgi:hypothetical protein